MRTRRSPRRGRGLALIGIAATLGIAAPPDAPAPQLEVPAAPAAQAPPAAGKPVAEFPEVVHDFGEVIRGKALRHSFVVRNTGDAPLEIQSVHPT